jgi:hypothetical protein
MCIDRETDSIDESDLQEDFANTWIRIAEMLPKNSKAGKWTAEKVEYAWYHGISARCQISLDPVHWSEEVSRVVAETMSNKNTTMTIIL